MIKTWQVSGDVGLGAVFRCADRKEASRAVRWLPHWIDDNSGDDIIFHGAETRHGSSYCARPTGNRRAGATSSQWTRPANITWQKSGDIFGRRMCPTSLMIILSQHPLANVSSTELAQRTPLDGTFSDDNATVWPGLLSWSTPFNWSWSFRQVLELDF